MDIKQRLQQAIDKQRIVAYEPIEQVRLCEAALAEISRLEFNLSAIKGAVKSALAGNDTSSGYYATVLRDIVNADIGKGMSPELLGIAHAQRVGEDS